MAAIQLVMMQANTSLIFSSAFSNPGIAPHRAPASIPPRKASSQMMPTGTDSEGMPSATDSETSVPIRYWPGAPMLNSPVLKATATERPVMISGMARKSILPTFWALKPQVSAPAASRPVLRMPAKIRRTPSHIPVVVIFCSARPTIMTTMLPSSRPARMDSREARTFLVPFLAYRSVSFCFTPSHPLSCPPAWRRPYRDPTPAR